MKQPIHPLPKILAFDVFGTVVDWHGSIAAEVEALIPHLDGDAFALAWRKGYQPAMARVMAELRDGTGSFVLIDDLHRQILDSILLEFGAVRLSESQKQQLNLAWHRLKAWPDTVAGLTQLKQQFTICTLSNGNIDLLTNMAKNANLPWDCILSAEIFKAYKPDPRAYLGVAKVFNLEPHEVMLVAAHQEDLVAARASGLQTAYIERPLEFGTKHTKDVTPNADNTYHAADFLDLAVQLNIAAPSA